MNLFQRLFTGLKNTPTVGGVSMNLFQRLFTGLKNTPTVITQDPKHPGYFRIRSAQSGRVIQLRLRRDTSAKWNEVDPVLLLDEPGIEVETGKLKMGDGVNVWSELPYCGEINKYVLKMPDSKGE